MPGALYFNPDMSVGAEYSRNKFINKQYMEVKHYNIFDKNREDRCFKLSLQGMFFDRKLKVSIKKRFSVHDVFLYLLVSD